jgi:acetylornithine deacetylase/succinyl-diaminopimelate desuccinylase-like protein
VADPAAAKELVERGLDYEEVKRILLRLVRFPSPQTPLLEREPQVLALIREIVLPELEGAGLRPRLDGIGNLVASVGEERSGRDLLLLSYAMTAAPGTMADPYSGKLLDGTPYGAPGECVWGRGACEQKGSLAAMVAALKLAARERRRVLGKVHFLTSTAGETGRHDSVAYALEHGAIEAEWAIVDGPPEIQLGNKGRVDILVTVRGRACHSSRPWEGIDAIEGAAAVLERLRPLLPYPCSRAHPRLGRVSLAPTSIESFPKATHTVQSECRILFDRRLLPGDDPDEAVAELREAIGSIEPFAIEVERRDFMYPSEVSADAPLVRALGGAIRAVLGREPETSYGTAANDTGYLNARGIQAVNYGARDIRFQHTDHDLVSVRRVYEAAKVFAFLIFCR